MLPIDLKQSFGPEYPAAIMCDGIRMAIQRESRFMRFFHSEAYKQGCLISRFEDGSASITALELEQEWPKWTEETRTDFCQSAYPCLFHQPDFAQMLRFILKCANEHVPGIALSVAYVLPQEEAFDALVKALRTVPVERTSNIVQAIAVTKHAKAKVALRGHLASLWSNPTLWDNPGPMNFVAHAAIICIANLIGLGEAPSNFTEKVRKLSDHHCPRVRKSCRLTLSKYYPWLTTE